MVSKVLKGCAVALSVALIIAVSFALDIGPCSNKSLEVMNKKLELIESQLTNNDLVLEVIAVMFEWEGMVADYSGHEEWEIRKIRVRVSSEELIDAAVIIQSKVDQCN